MANTTKELIDAIKSQSEFLDCYEIGQEDIFFEDRVRLKCFQCKKYDRIWTCPPKIPNLDYEKIIKEYNNILLVVCEYPIKKDMFEKNRIDSSNILHKSLLYAEKLLWDWNYPLAVSFIGGSCKLCAQGCDENTCRQKHLARIPIEATGINVVKTAAKFVAICFPPKNYIHRVGLLLW